MAFQSRSRPQICYKAVAHVNDRFFSIFDGETEYRLFEPRREHVQPFHRGGYYVFERYEDILNISVPRMSELANAPWVILKCECWGKCERYGKKIAFEYIRPISMFPFPDVSEVPTRLISLRAETFTLQQEVQAMEERLNQIQSARSAFS
eukprot:TRINITY_DN17644_c0_g1::TRINITY_DN17644_c0_g1_i1::g.11409::m.11409 TRINITY_DN17644_c0_g1::TRINITY_DN17644_c0_g1_i1::g.11409  ORF type:complete len:150 (-),score=-4.41,Microtub_assoc/PF07989.6/0.13 TRINITY_DN17644_c0_g1_i1:35-484(-)